MAATAREILVKNRLFLTGSDDRAVARTRLSSANSTRESITLPHHQQSAGTARRVTERMCAAACLSEETCQAAVLLTSELVTNALLHARGSQRLSVTTRAEGVLVEVGDDNRDMPVMRPLDDSSAHGRGVQLVESFASSWGSRVTVRGKCTWFTVSDS
jgi:two-component sensor histidine kinase